MQNKIQPSVLEHQKRMAEKRADEIVDKAVTVIFILTGVYLSIHLIVWIL